MNPILFKNAQLVDPNKDTVARGNILVDEGVIQSIDASPNAPEHAETVDCSQLHLAPGIVDVGVKIGEPGERHKESFRTAGKAAAAGGVTTIIARPDTATPIDTPEVLEFVTRRAAEATSVRIRHMAALTKGLKGHEMTEIGFLLDAGALAFWDGLHSIQNTKIYSRALNYARSLGALVFAHPQEPYLSEGAVATNGKLASLMGLPSVSPMAERLGVDREIGLAEASSAKMHLDQITVARALPPLARAKSHGFDISASISIHHLTLNSHDIADYRSFFKFTPPLRHEEDRQAVIAALSEGVIDWVASFHTPQDEEAKRLPFEAAASGAVGLETLLPAALRLVHSGSLSLPKLFRALSLAPSKRLGLPGGRLEKGAPADLLLFDPNKPFILDRFKLHSKAKNTPFDGAKLQGVVHSTYVGGVKVFG